MMKRRKSHRLAGSCIYPSRRLVGSLRSPPLVYRMRSPEPLCRMRASMVDANGAGIEAGFVGGLPMHLMRGRLMVKGFVAAGVEAPWSSAHRDVPCGSGGTGRVCRSSGRRLSRAFEPTLQLSCPGLIPPPYCGTPEDEHGRYKTTSHPSVLMCRHGGFSHE